LDKSDGNEENHLKAIELLKESYKFGNSSAKEKLATLGISIL
jgi:hypothetical protein